MIQSSEQILRPSSLVVKRHVSRSKSPTVRIEKVQRRHNSLKINERPVKARSAVVIHTTIGTLANSNLLSVKYLRIRIILYLVFLSKQFSSVSSNPYSQCQSLSREVRTMKRKTIVYLIIFATIVEFECLEQ